MVVWIYRFRRLFFLISPDAIGNVRFRFKIRLHKDDLSTLEHIKTTLDSGLIRIEGYSAVYIIRKLKEGL